MLDQQLPCACEAGDLMRRLVREMAAPLRHKQGHMIYTEASPQTSQIEAWGLPVGWFPRRKADL